MKKALNSKTNYWKAIDKDTETFNVCLSACLWSSKRNGRRKPLVVKPCKKLWSMRQYLFSPMMRLISEALETTKEAVGSHTRTASDLGVATLNLKAALRCGSILINISKTRIRLRQNTTTRTQTSPNRFWSYRIIFTKPFRKSILNLWNKNKRRGFMVLSGCEIADSVKWSPSPISLLNLDWPRRYSLWKIQAKIDSNQLEQLKGWKADPRDSHLATPAGKERQPPLWCGRCSFSYWWKSRHCTLRERFSWPCF